MDGSPQDQIPTTLRLLVVLEEVARDGVPVTPTEVNARLGLPKPTIHRLFATLCDEGFLQKDIDGRSYAPGRRLRRMSTGVLSSLRIRSARLAVLRKLSVEIGETCNISLPEHDGMVYLERIETEWPLRIQLPIGTKVPLYATASGKMYLSTLPTAHLNRYARAEVLKAHTPNTLIDPVALIDEIGRVRRDGYSLDREEFMDGMVALAVPVKDANGRLVVTLSFHAPVQRFTPQTVLRHLEPLRKASEQLTSLMDES